MKLLFCLLLSVSTLVNVNVLKANDQAAPAHHEEHKREIGPVSAEQALNFLHNGNKKIGRAHV